MKNLINVGQTKINTGIVFKDHLRNVKDQEEEKSPVALTKFNPLYKNN